MKVGDIVEVVFLLEPDKEETHLCEGARGVILRVERNADPLFESVCVVKFVPGVIPDDALNFDDDEGGYFMFESQLRVVQ